MEILKTISKNTDESLKRLRQTQTRNDKVKKRMVKPWIQRVVKQADNPKPTNPMMLWHSKRQNHKLLKTTKDPRMIDKLKSEIIEADAQIIKNLDEESLWFEDTKKKLGNQYDKENGNTKTKK
jgi:membrane-anchored protein YejM (alkaline phosphatase superfamily)